LTTHIMFGLLVGAIFFSKPEFILLVGLGSAIPDMDREYGFFRRDSFRDKQIHRALFHNFLFIGLLYLINPFLAIGAFLHTLLDALTTAKDRGIEWLFPFTRFVKNALYDEEGKKLKVPPGKKILFYQNDLIEAARKSDEDLRENKPTPWRRTYGPALSGRLLDQSVGIGSFFVFAYLVAMTRLGIHDFIDLSQLRLPDNVLIPISIAIIGIAIELGTGELDRRRMENHKERHPLVYHSLFLVSIILLIIALLLAVAYNWAVAENVFLIQIPIIIGGALVATTVATFILFVRPRKKIKQETGPSII
jgi:membrane-bound metal-dependent hydrolase YbcI (DUF457 family)